jgi:hypothetical protein
MTDSADPLYPVVWLWDAGSHSGVAGREQDAVEAAGECIGIAGTAVVELARLAPGPDLVLVHKRTGVGSKGTAADGVVSWAPMRRAA